MSDSLWPHELQHTRVHVLHYLPKFAQTHVHWVSDVIQPSSPLSPSLFSSCLQSFPASGSISMSQLFESGGQSIGASASASVFPMNVQDWFPEQENRIDLFDILAVQGTLKSLLQRHNLKASVLQCLVFLILQHVTTGKNHSFDYTDLCWQSDVFAL